MNIQHVTLPLSPTDMVEYFKDKTQHYEVDMDATLEQMTERSMLLYLANLNINCSFSKITPALLREYLTMKDFVNSPMLMATHANLLHYVKYSDVLYEPALAKFDIEMMCKFAKDNIQLIAEQCMFLDSFLLYALTREADSTIEHYNIDTELHDEIGFSVLSLLSYEDFMIMYSTDTPPIENQTYYEPYFDDYIFKGKNLFHYAHTSPLFGMISVIRNVQTV